MNTTKFEDSWNISTLNSSFLNRPNISFQDLRKILIKHANQTAEHTNKGV